MLREIAGAPKGMTFRRTPVSERDINKLRELSFGEQHSSRESRVRTAKLLIELTHHLEHKHRLLRQLGCSKRHLSRRVPVNLPRFHRRVRQLRFDCHFQYRLMNWRRNRSRSRRSKHNMQQLSSQNPASEYQADSTQSTEHGISPSTYPPTSTHSGVYQIFSRFPLSRAAKSWE